MTTLIGPETYGSEVDVTQDVDISDYIREDGIGNLKRELDNGDYDIGIFTHGFINLKAINFDGRFNPPEDYRSLFVYSRDRAKVEIKFNLGDDSTSIRFKGLLNDEATRQSFKNDIVTFKVLSLDSILRKVKVAGGLVSGGSSASTAIKNILSVPEVTSVLNYDEANIEVDNDITIDTGSYFDNLTTKDALDDLLVASNSVAYVDSSDNIIVRTRTETVNNIFNFYGSGDVFGRENIIDIRNYNTGLQRTFNSVIVNNQNSSNDDLIDTFGLRSKNTSFDFITDNDTAMQVADGILDEFKYPKEELDLITYTSEVQGLELLDVVTVDMNFRRTPEGENDLPYYGVSKYGTAIYPKIEGNLKIRPSKAWKVIGIREDPKTFQTTVKLRVRGNGVDDSTIYLVGTFYGAARYGLSTYQEDPDRIDPNYRSVRGAAIYGTVRYGNVLP